MTRRFPNKNVNVFNFGQTNLIKVFRFIFSRPSLIYALKVSATTVRKSALCDFCAQSKLELGFKIVGPLQVNDLSIRR